MRLRRHRSLFLLAVILSLLLTSPLLMKGTAVELQLGFVFAVLVGFGAYALYPTRRWLLTFAFLALFTILLAGIHLWFSQEHFVLALLIHASLLAIHLVTLGTVLRYAISEQATTAQDRVIAGICGYFVLALIWSSGYRIILLFDPQAIIASNTGMPIDSPEVIYYSLVTLTTQGYGDIIPTHPFARIAAGMEGALGTIYLAVLIATLVNEMPRKSD